MYFSKYNLDQRAFLGPTSTDNTLAFIMANFAQVRKNDFVIDPFFGTGSLMIPVSFFKGVVFGADMDIRVL